MSADSALRRRYRALGELQERFEGSPIGQSIISAVVIVILLIGVVWSLPASAIQRTVAPALRPAALALGLDQDWGVFAPGPPLAATTIEVHVLVEGDTTPRTWRPPHGNALYGQYSWYRWQKLKEWVLAPSSGFALPAFAHWVVREMTRPTEQPTYVKVVERIEPLSPPGASVALKPSHLVVYREHLARRP